MQPGVTVELSFPWTPDVGHRCIEAAIIYPADTIFFNNLTQRNIQVRPRTSPALFQFNVENPLPAGAIIEVVPRITEAGWFCRVDQQRFALDPFKDCPRQVNVTVDRGAALPQPSIQPNSRTLLGGVTARAVDATVGTADCHVYVFAKKCDVNNDGTVDRNDINIIFADRRGFYTANDARTCTLMCANALCAP